MNETEKAVLDQFKECVCQTFPDSRIILFGSRAKGIAELHSDMDVLVILSNQPDDSARDYVSECAWAAGYKHGIVVVPVVFGKDEWETGPERFSLLAKAIDRDGVAI